VRPSTVAPRQLAYRLLPLAARNLGLDVDLHNSGRASVAERQDISEDDGADEALPLRLARARIDAVRVDHLRELERGATDPGGASQPLSYSLYNVTGVDADKRHVALDRPADRPPLDAAVLGREIRDEPSVESRPRGASRDRGHGDLIDLRGEELGGQRDLVLDDDVDTPALVTGMRSRRQYRDEHRQQERSQQSLHSSPGSLPVHPEHGCTLLAG